MRIQESEANQGALTVVWKPVADAQPTLATLEPYRAEDTTETPVQVGPPAPSGFWVVSSLRPCLLNSNTP